jgi:uncharacterized protein (DUF2062 family)
MGLYGFPLSKSFNINEEEKAKDSRSFHHKEGFEFGWKPVAIGYACGAVFGMMLGSIVFLIGKPQWLINLVESIPNQRVKKKCHRSNANRRRPN